MLTENTVNKLQEMKLSAMARAFKDQLTDSNMVGLSFEDRFGLLVDTEWTSRKNNYLKRLIKNAKFSEHGACVEEIEYHAERNLDKAKLPVFLPATTWVKGITSCCLVQLEVVRPILLVHLVCPPYGIFLL